MKSYYLSISIPTYNRLSYLDKNIENILKQIYNSKLEDKICIDVFDNCSPDKTYQYLKTKYKNYDNFYVHPSNTNKGMDRNFQRCIYESSSNNYVWLLSDDDVVVNDGIIKVYNKIKENEEISLFFLNLYNFEREFKQNTKLPIKFKLDDDFVTKDIDGFISILGIWITFLSSIVINKKHLISKDESDKFIGTYFIQSHIALNNIKNGKYAMITKDAIIACRGGNTGGYNLYYVWVEQYKKLLLETAVDCGASIKICKDIFVNSMCGTLKYLVINIRSSDSSFEDKNRFILFKNTFMYPKVYIHLYPFAYCPKFILRALRKIRRAFK